MINPNISKRVIVNVLNDKQCEFDGQVWEIHYRSSDIIKRPGKRYLYLKFSIMRDQYYLSARA